MSDRWASAIRLRTIVTLRATIGNRFFRSAGLLPVFVSAFGLLLVLLGWMNTFGALPTELDLMLCRTLFRPLVWLIDNGCLEWIAELLKIAATP